MDFHQSFGKCGTVGAYDHFGTSKSRHIIHSDNLGFLTIEAQVVTSLVSIDMQYIKWGGGREVIDTFDRMVNDAISKYTSGTLMAHHFAILKYARPKILHPHTNIHIIIIQMTANQVGVKSNEDNFAKLRWDDL